MSERLFNTRSVIAMTLLVVVGISCVVLGLWQLDRASQRRAAAESIQAGRAAAVLSLNTKDLVTAGRVNWTPATAQGYWRPEYSVLLDNRNLDGRPGLWLATPLLLSDDRAVLVLRGWFARPLGEHKSPVIPSSDELQEIKGELSEHVPRLFELWSSNKPSPLNFVESALNLQNRNQNTSSLSGRQQPADFIDTAQLPRLQNLTVVELSRQTGLNFLPVVLLQTSVSNDGLIRKWPEPAVDADKNVGYAVQWFGFATICLIALIVFGGRARRRT